jgi:hypothetical protein
VTTRWLQKKKCYVVNIVSAVVLRSIWLTRNDFIFHSQVWADVKTIVRRMWSLTQEWIVMVKAERRQEMENWLSFLVRVKAYEVTEYDPATPGGEPNDQLKLVQKEQKMVGLVRW